MSLENKTVLVSGANRGIGASLVRHLLQAGVRKIYAGARDIAKLPDFGDGRIEPLQLDVTDAASIERAAKTAGDIDVLINNAGILQFTDFMATPLDVLNADMVTNFYGTLHVTRAFVPGLAARGGGTIVNNVSIVGLVAVAPMGGYSASKAALHSLTQTLRVTLKPQGIDVLGIYPGPIDTELARDIPLAKATPDEAAANIVRGIENGDAYIFPDPTAQQIEYLWANNGRQLEAAVAAAG